MTTEISREARELATKLSDACERCCAKPCTPWEDDCQYLVDIEEWMDGETTEAKRVGQAVKPVPGGVCAESWRPTDTHKKVYPVDNFRQLMN